MEHHGKGCQDAARPGAYSGAADGNLKLILNLRNINHTMRALYEGKGSQKQVLILLLESGTITQRALTERLGIQPGSASEVIGKLENAGLILRTSSADDRRTADISLTEEGRRRAAEASEQRQRRHEQMFSCLSGEEKAQLLTLLEKINLDWDTRYREPAAQGCPAGRHGRRTHPGRTKHSAPEE